jgi:hypothetical protein
MSPISATPGHSGQPADAGQDYHRLDPWVGSGEGGDLVFQPGDRFGETVQEGKVVLDNRPRGRRQLQLGQPDPAHAGPQPGLLPDPLVGQDRVDAILGHRRQAHQAGPMAQQRRRSRVAWARSRPPAADRPAAAAPAYERPPCRSSTGPRRSPCSGWDGPDAVPAPAPPAAQPATPSRRRPRTRLGAWR